MMRLHPREEIVRKAEIDLREVVLQWGKRHTDMTTAEYLKVLLGVCTDDAQSILKYVIREERHPDDPDKPGGIK